MTPTVRKANDERVSDTVIDAVAAATGTDPLDLPPLSEAIDLDALDSLYRHRDGRRQGFSGRVVFTVAGCDVTVTGDGRVVAVTSQSEPEPQAATG